MWGRAHYAGKQAASMFSLRASLVTPMVWRETFGLRLAESPQSKTQLVFGCSKSKTIRQVCVPWAVDVELSVTRPGGGGGGAAAPSLRGAVTVEGALRLCASARQTAAAPCVFARQGQESECEQGWFTHIKGGWCEGANLRVGGRLTPKGGRGDLTAFVARCRCATGARIPPSTLKSPSSKNKKADVGNKGERESGPERERARARVCVSRAKDTTGSRGGGVCCVRNRHSAPKGEIVRVRVRLWPAAAGSASLDLSPKKLTLTRPAARRARRRRARTRRRP